MTTRRAPVEDLLDLSGVRPEDRAWALGLLAGPDAPDAASVEEVLAHLADALGTFPPERQAWAHDGVDERAAAAALLRFAPTTRGWLADHGVADELVRATLADLGQQAVVHRARHGRPGLGTWWWTALVAAGGFVEVGRLQLQLHRQPVALAAGRSADGTSVGPVAPGAWVLGLHVPARGRLEPAAVDDALARAAAGFVRWFGDLWRDGGAPVAGTCTSWLLDPALREHLPGSNVAAFGARFALDGAVRRDPAQVLLFVHDHVGGTAPHDLAGLPRRSSLQRLVVDRAARGDGGVASGHLALPAATRGSAGPAV
ncbi:acyltransferase domain-containing protein [Pseudokineococcus basanitobsidens]|uniref:Acyltransferase domain-containing protein n=1 Tax=Pseudokineococcus basanitobsidens TaxID=1926649 RepID=A0ABU8RNT6_9ACTN